MIRPGGYLVRTLLGAALLAAALPAAVISGAVYLVELAAQNLNTKRNAPADHG